MDAETCLKKLQYVGVLAFALGVAVTILCFRFRNLQEQDEEDQHD